MSEDTSFDFIHQVAAIRQNDEKVLEKLYQTMYPAVEKFVRENNGTIDEAKDVYQEAFIILWRSIKLEKFQPGNASSLHAYLFRIAKNKWIDQLRAVKKNPVIGLADVPSELADDSFQVLHEDEEKYLADVKLQFRQLGEACRDLLTRFYFLRQSLREIAIAKNLTEATAKNNKYRCLQQLRKSVNMKNSTHE